MTTVKLINDNCIDILPTLESNSIDCIITDPPYFLDSLDNNWSTEIQQKRKSNSHIAGLPMGMKFDPRQGKNFEKFMSEISKELFRVLKPGGFFLCFSSSRMYHNAVAAIENSGFHIRDQLIWRYNPGQTKAFKQDHIIDNDKVMTPLQKFILKNTLKNHRTPQLRAAFEPICLAMKPQEGRLIDNFQKWGVGLMKVNPEYGVSENVLNFSKPSKNERTGNNHPTVKPVALIEYLLDMYCPENGTVLDPFIGSGTTAVAAKNKNINVIGIDINKEYIEISKNRTT